MPRDLHMILKAATKLGASDVHFKVGTPPTTRINGVLQSLADQPRLTAEELSQLASTILTGPQRERFKRQLDIDLSYSVPGLGRFRVNIFLQRGTIGMVFRVIPFKVSSFESLMLPEIVKSIAEERRGLVLVTGTTGCGKSTTLAAMIEHINSSRTAHIVTIEDPIEFLHQDRLALIHQREVGDDTLGFAEALRRVLRQDPDVILIGEMRDLPTIDAALKAAETGHLVLSTLHTVDAGETINRILDFYPGNLQRQIRLLLASTLRGIISQRLLPRADGSGRVVATEVLVNNERVAERIADPALTSEIPDVIAQSGYYGMETFDQAILRLFSDGFITFVEGLRHATKPADLRLRAQQLGLIPT